MWSPRSALRPACDWRRRSTRALRRGPGPRRPQRGGRPSRPARVAYARARVTPMSVDAHAEQPGRWTAVDTIAGLLATVSIFTSCVGLAYRPVRLIPFAILLALIAALHVRAAAAARRPGDRRRRGLLDARDDDRRRDRESALLGGRWYNTRCERTRRRRSELGLRAAAARGLPREPRRRPRRVARAVRERRQRPGRLASGPASPARDARPRQRPRPAALAGARGCRAGRERAGGRRRAVTGELDETLLGGVAAAMALVKAHRMHGHLAARLDPLGSEPLGDPALDETTADPAADAGAAGTHPGQAAPRPRSRRDAARGAARPARGLLRHDRLRDRAHVGPRRARLAPAGDRIRPLPAAADRRGAGPAARSRLAGRRVRAVPPPRLPRPEAVLARGSGLDGADARRGDRDRRGRRRPRGRDRHGPPRAAQRSRPHRRPLVRVDPARVRG